MDALILRERVANTISLGESHFREFKSAFDGPPEKKRRRLVKHICADISEALVAFSNADGGDLLIGVEDNGDVTGVPHGDSDIDAMLSAPKTHLYPGHSLPLLGADRLAINGQGILWFSVAKGTSEVFQLADGRCVARRDRSTVPATPKQILFDRQETRSREYDRAYVDGASVVDLDVAAIQTMADNYLQGLSAERYLQQLGIADYMGSGLRLRMAALLLFAKEIQRWHPRSSVRILKVSGTELKSGEQYNVLSDESVQGNIFDLILKSWEKLRPFLAYKTEFGADSKFEQKYLYPEQACKEALVNAVAHRDYGIQNGIDVFIFDDRMEIRSPGALLSTLSIADLELLQGAHESRNALVAKVLRETNFMRELGEGMKRMFALMEESELDKPTLHSDGTSFSVTLPHKSVFTSKQEQWLLMFQQFNLSTLQKKIVVLGMDGREIAPAEIYKAINTADRNTYDREVTALRKKHLLVEIRTNPQATGIARRNKVSKAEVPRFKVQTPGVLAVPEPQRRTRPEPRPRASTPSVVERPPRRYEISAHAVFFMPVGDETTEVEIRDMFAGAGTVLDVRLPVDRTTGIRRGFGFVYFGTSAEVQIAVRTLNGSTLRGRRLRVDERRT